MKSMLKAPKTKYLKLKYDGLVSSFAFKIELRRYTLGTAPRRLGAGIVGWCRLNLSNPC